MTHRVLRLEFLPAGHGDCIWIEVDLKGTVHRVLIDGGTPGSARVLQERIDRAGRPVTFELVIVTHVDSDHIGGILGVLESPKCGVDIRDLWFNGRKHLSDELGGVQAERLTKVIEARFATAWNARFGGKAVVLPATGPLPHFVLPGGLHVTLLSPTRAKLAALAPKWEKEVIAAGLAPGGEPEGAQSEGEPSDLLGSDEPDVEELVLRGFKPDETLPNGSSVAVLLELDGRAVLLAADAHPEVLVESLGTLLAERKETKLHLELLKVSHHGSRNNTDDALLGLVSSRRFVISTNGAVFHHPHDEAIARIVRSHKGQGIEVAFNYAERGARWDSRKLSKQYGYTVNSPPDGQPLVLEL